MFNIRSILLTISLCSLLAISLGKVLVSASSRMLNSQPTGIEQAPYIVQFRDIDKKPSSYCAGTLVTPKYVVTAAHCFLNRQPQNVMIVGGVNTVYETGVQRRIANVIRHPEYSNNTAHTDIAILELNGEMSGDNIATIPICQQQLEPGNYVQVFGWGFTEDNRPAPQLRTARFPVQEAEVCPKRFGPFVAKNMFCTTSEVRQNTGEGDSGGPAVYRNQLCGIVAFGYDRHSAYTDVFKVRSFIKSITGV